jgi:hypothetical protein
MNASRQSLIGSAVICTALVALFAARYLLMPYPIESTFVGGMPLATALTGLTVQSPWIALACVAVILVWTLLLVVQMTVKFGPAGSRNYLPPQIFLILAAGIVISGEGLAALVTALLLTMALRQFVFAFHKDHRFGEVFNAGFYLGFMPLLYAPAAVIVLPVALCALAVYRRSAREAVVMFTGLLLPAAGAEFIRWAVGSPQEPYWHEVWNHAMEQRHLLTQIQTLPRAAIVVAGLVLLLVLSAMLWAAWHKKGIRKVQYKFVQQSSVTLLFVVASALVPGATTTLVALGAVACALVLPYAYANRTAGGATFIYCLVLLAVLALDLLPFWGVSIP